MFVGSYFIAQNFATFSNQYFAKRKYSNFFLDNIAIVVFSEVKLIMRFPSYWFHKPYYYTTAITLTVKYTTRVHNIHTHIHRKTRKLKTRKVGQMDLSNFKRVSWNMYEIFPNNGTQFIFGLTFAEIHRILWRAF